MKTNRTLFLPFTFVGAAVLFASVATAQDTKKPANAPPPSAKSSPTVEECSPAENANKKTAAAASASTSVTPVSDTIASTATEESASAERTSLKLKSSLDDRDEMKPSKAAANQCDSSEAASDLTLQKQ